MFSPGARVNKLYYGDNLKVLRDHIASDSVDLGLPLVAQNAYLVFCQREGCR